MDEIKDRFGWLHDVPDEFKSRKLIIVIFTMLLLFVVALVATITSQWFGFNEGIWRDAMLYITGAGGAGTAAQTIPDALQARNGSYRQGYYNNTEKVSTSPYAPTSIIPVSENIPTGIVSVAQAIPQDYGYAPTTVQYPAYVPTVEASPPTVKARANLLDLL